MNEMTKSEAIEIFNNMGYNLSSRNASWATLNKTIPVYWSNAPVTCLNMNWYLMLHDNVNCRVYLFYIPQNSIQNSALSTRTDNPNRLHIEINYDDPLFRDRRSTSRCYSFKKFLVNEFQY